MKETSVRSESNLGISRNLYKFFTVSFLLLFLCQRLHKGEKKPKVIPRLINLNSAAPPALQYYKVSFDDIGVAQSNLAQFIQHRNWDEQCLMVRATALSSWY